MQVQSLTGVETTKEKRGRRISLWIGGGILVALTLLLVTARIVGFEPSQERRQFLGLEMGLWLKGDVETAPITDWSFVEKITEGPHEAGGYPLAKIQTREWLFPLIAYSVNTSCLIYDRNLYVGALYVAGVKYPDGRHWNKNVYHHPRVRIKLGNKLYDKTLVLVTEPGEQEALDKEWDKRRPYAADPGLIKFWYRVMPNDQA